MNKRIVIIWFMFFTIMSCRIHRLKYTIEDYILVANAKEILGKKGLTAIVFESNKKILPFQHFLVQHYNLQTLNQREIPFTLNDVKFVLHVYDNDEIVKYINTADFVLKEQIPDTSKVGFQADFVVLSVVNDRNEDCLADGSLYQYTIIQYLKKLKASYLSNDR